MTRRRSMLPAVLAAVLLAGALPTAPAVAKDGAAKAEKVKAGKLTYAGASGRKNR